ncbi:hypothetical protein [Amycolatopsis sp. NPDC059657]|uniref:hypothetical protein n=1 Tax=Amycolatopsis sp. NPDC059657 TaxID=3346899 RepID=UPI003670AD92
MFSLKTGCSGPWESRAVIEVNQEMELASLRKFAAMTLLAAGLTLTGIGGVASAAETTAPSDTGATTMGVLCAQPWHAACW